ncbi:MAG: triose-phosphate isomerase [Candidatus Kerfeldbacteria bacterium]|nr:triose-phosphate isomerase [Candidatus Kerfeldbacteria bacterium]
MELKETKLTPLLVANWKMQLTVAESRQRLSELQKSLPAKQKNIEIVICPSFMALPSLAASLSGTPIRLGAQDVAWDERGAYTGEVSPLDLVDLGLGHVIIGHSERRHLLGETETMVARKMISAYSHGLMPILCVGESADDRAAARHEDVVRHQLETALRSVPPPGRGRHMAIAYEPVWAIGTGQPADPALAAAMGATIRQILINQYGPVQAERSFRLLYGGSVDDTNITKYVHSEGFQGALVGSASLNPSIFAKMITNVARSTSQKSKST